MNMTKKIVKRRSAFTLVELMVAIAIILVISALAVAFAPRVSDSQNLSRAVDRVQQWLLTAKMRAKRDGLATGLRFVQAQGDAAGTYSQFQYIQQPDSLSGGVRLGGSSAPLPITAYTYPLNSTNYYNGGLLVSATAGVVTFQGVDFTLGGLPQYDLAGRQQWLVQSGDYLEVRDGGLYLIGSVTGANTLTLANTVAGSYDANLTITTPTANYRILRQPRILIGEAPLALPNNYAVDMRQIGSVSPGTAVSNYLNPAGWNQPSPTGPSFYYDIVFSPTGAVVGTNANNSFTAVLVYDLTINPYDSDRAGIVGVQNRTGFIGAYPVNASPLLGSAFYYVQTARESGL